MSTSLLKTLRSRSPFDLEVGSLIPDFVWRGHVASYQSPTMPNVTYTTFYFYFENYEKVSLVRFP